MHQLQPSCCQHEFVYLLAQTHLYRALSLGKPMDAKRDALKLITQPTLFSVKFKAVFQKKWNCFEGVLAGMVYRGVLVVCRASGSRYHFLNKLQFWVKKKKGEWSERIRGKWNRPSAILHQKWLIRGSRIKCGTASHNIRFPGFCVPPFCQEQAWKRGVAV